MVKDQSGTVDRIGIGKCCCHNNPSPRFLDSAGSVQRLNNPWYRRNAVKPRPSSRKKKKKKKEEKEEKETFTKFPENRRDKKDVIIRWN